jgi:hypothetical protein
LNNLHIRRVRSHEAHTDNKDEEHMKTDEAGNNSPHGTEFEPLEFEEDEVDKSDEYERDEQGNQHDLRLGG